MKKILILITMFLSIFLIGRLDTFAVENIDIGSSSSSNGINNSFLDDLSGDKDINIGTNGEKSILELIYSIAFDLKTIIYIVTGLYFLIIALKLILSNKTDEEVSNFKKGILWITIGIIFMQISFYFVESLYAKEVGAEMASNLSKNIIGPLIKVLETAASFFFLLVAIYSFYRIITANGDEEKVKNGKMAIVYGLVGFIIIKLSKQIIYASYGRVDCNEYSMLGIFSVGGSNCSADNEITGLSGIVIQIINWLNGFVGIIVIIMIIYAGTQVLFSLGDEEKLSKAKKSIIYISIGIGILVLNYFILTFLVRPEVAITI